ncbi:CRAL-TRIO domain-containing protein [Absidia repens]|uniref:CRAL-TRIO domain-containing protein n=1 Tax=Absidia repens TaxID=90262 RepID=A0A1X2ID54_9FUNG|nr:CRAL-TRIO domain-containing protein [Absidia repens]
MFRFKSNGNTAADNKPSSPPITEKELPVTHKPIMTPPKDYQPANTAEITDDQQQKIDQLHEYMTTILLPTTHEYHENEKRFLSTGTLKRYMRARKWDYEAAKNMLENTVKWRRDYRPDQLDPDYIKPEAETGKMYFNGFDKCGRPVWIMRPRLQNSKDNERQVKHIVYSLERGIRLMPEKVENIAIIVDFKDSSASHNPSINTCKKFLDILGNHYPERLGIAFVVKSPWFFFVTFKMIAPFMDPVTKNKIKFVYDNVDGKQDNTKATTNEWVHLQDFISNDQLETDFSGDYHYKYDLETYWDQLLDYTGKPYKVIDY